jgi:hypothetical protein
MIRDQSSRDERANFRESQDLQLLIEIDGHSARIANYQKHLSPEL